MKKVYALMLWIILLLVPFRTFAEGWDEWNQLVDQSLQFVKQEDYVKAKQMLVSATGFPITASTPEHSRIISMAYDKAVRAMDEGSQQEKEDDILALQLVIDAENSKLQPIWLHRHDNVISAFQKMETSLQKQNNSEYQYALNEFLYQLDIIYPSLSIDLKESELNQLNTNLTYLEDSRNVMLKQSDSTKQMQGIRKEIESIFRYPEQDQADPSLIWMMISTGGIIIFTLTYVGWRKYKGEQEKRKHVKSKNR